MEYLSGQCEYPQKLNEPLGKSDLLSLYSSEIFLLVVCGCIPTLKPLYEQYRGRSLSKSRPPPGKSYTFPRKRSYQITDDSDAPYFTSDANYAYHNGNTTYITGLKGKSRWSDADGSEELELGNINVRNTIKVDVDGETAGLHPARESGNDARV